MKKVQEESSYLNTNFAPSHWRYLTTTVYYEKQKKSEFAKAITSVVNYDSLNSTIPLFDGHDLGYVIDGGALLHMIKWSKNEEFPVIYLEFPVIYPV